MRKPALILILLFSALTLTACPSLTGDEEEPYADFFNTVGTTTSLPVRGRLVEEELPVRTEEATPIGELAQDELPGAEVSLVLVSGSTRTELATLTTDDEGYIDADVTLPSGIAPGRYTIEVEHGGATRGSFQTRLLPLEHTGILVRSDIDLTYLFTDFMSNTALVELLGEDATERVALPAMERVYPALRAGVSGSENRPLSFLSGSPLFFKRILESKCALDGVQQDGLSLKPFKEITSTTLLSDPTAVVPALEEQVGYKLLRLLELRLESPAGAQEILLGDDSEADFVIYNLYHRFTYGALDANALLAELDTLGIAESWRTPIATLLPQVSAHITASPSVLGIFINITGSDHSSYAIDDWDLADVGHHHQGAWPLILSLFEADLVSAAAVEDIRARLLDLGQTQNALDAAAQAMVDRGELSADTVTSFAP